jgi:putative SOS response-associated peptidase YedK
MCYSAQIWSDYRTYVRKMGAGIDIKRFGELYWHRHEGSKAKIPKAMDAGFLEAATFDEGQVGKLIADYNAAEATKLEQEIFKQRKRRADAERTLQTKTTKKAQEDLRISTEKVVWALGKLSDLSRTDLKPRDSRISPGWYAPVLFAENGKRVVTPMRYQCRPAGKPAFYDTKYPGTYNARRDNLEGFWKDLFGFSHGIMVVERFFENVERLDDDGKPRNVVLEFTPADGQAMLVACLWSRWTDPSGAELLSFATITDEPPPEVAAAGHDRCIVPIKPENVDAWLNPAGQDLATMYAILDDRPRPFYEHRVAMAA